jgi:Ulp1 protease family, C-terminal catalytic domain
VATSILHLSYVPTTLFNDFEEKMTTMMKKKYKPDELIIDYHDAVIYGRDLALLENRKEWLNDSCIHFYFTYLQQQHQQRTKTTNHDRPSQIECRPCLFMDPSAVSFWMHQCTDQEDLDDFMKGVSFPTRNTGGFIFVPINDNHAIGSEWNQPGAGTHWSLLVVYVSKTDSTSNRQDHHHNEYPPIKYYHFDSSSSSSPSNYSGNHQAAQDVVQRFQQDVYNFTAKESSATTATTMMMIAPTTPQQTNAYDCGVHVLGSAKVISALLYNNNNNDDYDDADKIILLWCEEIIKTFGPNPAMYCAELRKEIALEIRLAAEQKTTTTTAATTTTGTELL